MEHFKEHLTTSLLEFIYKHPCITFVSAEQERNDRTAIEKMVQQDLEELVHRLVDDLQSKTLFCAKSTCMNFKMF